MKALTFRGTGRIEYETVPDPRLLAPGDVIVKTRLCAICGSDMHVYHGRERGLDPGTVMGHEFIGEIVETGREVQRFRVGDAVFSPFFSACGGCFYCEQDLSCRCQRGQLFGWVERGVGLQGVQAEFVRVPLADTTLYAIPEAVEDEAALLLCDILPTGWFCADMAGARPGGSYAVIGCGPVGLLAIISLREMGAGQILAVDLVPERRAMAARLGAIPFDGASPDLVKNIHGLSGGRGPDAVLEVVGLPAAQQLAYLLVRPGGVLAVAGVHNAAKFAFQPADLYNKNLTYRTGRCPVQRYVPRLLPLVQQRKYDFSALISHRLPLRDGVRGYEMFDQKIEGCTKVVLRP
ncbi:MAG: alcohol dehydrogenase catalytic domain-containing protein [Calditrichaeota bacterium]|nr:alcohol dehydrogenase catalytic domain-containing protein [Calditrichota bacterium]MCB0303555.1 alcohol dehydrogenase catalytic domain-containing protein [Calditrichota bacterium]